MSGWRGGFGWLQKIGKSLMLPVSVLPAAGILLGVGSARFTWLPEIVSTVMAQAGGAIFGNLPLLFAISVSIASLLAVSPPWWPPIPSATASSSRPSGKRPTYTES